MQRSWIAVVAVVCAVLGGVSALAVGKATGWIAETRSETVVVTAPAAPARVAAPAPAAVPARARPLSSNGFDPARIYAERAAGVVTVFTSFGDSVLSAQGQGSGFVVSRKGYILTNAHVITNVGDGPLDPDATEPDAEDAEPEPATQLYVQFQDRDRVPARIVGWDLFNDVGVLRVDPLAHALEPLPLGDSTRVKVGEPVAAIGSPFGNEGSLSVGVVSAIGRSIPALTSRFRVAAIQTDAPINRGNSGGPLLDARGSVIGINAQIRSDSGNAEGVGFAIPTHSARRSLTQLVTKGRVVYPYVGITTENLTPSLARRLGYRTRYGALIASVESESPGARAGLRGGNEELRVNGLSVTRGGDVIVAIAGMPVRSADDVVRIVSERLRPGRRTRFVVLRGGRRRTVTVTLGERPANP